MTGILSRLSRALSGRPRAEGDDQDWAPPTGPAASPERPGRVPGTPSPAAEAPLVDQVIAAAAAVAGTRRSLEAGSERHSRASRVEEQLVRLAARLQGRLAAGLEVSQEEIGGNELLQAAADLVTGGTTPEPSTEDSPVTS